MKKTLRIITVAVAAVVLCVIVTVYRHSVFVEAAAITGNDNGLWLRAVCDGTFVTAVMYISVGILGWVADLGGFDGFAFMMYSLVRKLTPIKKQFEDRISYYDFKVARQEREKGDKLFFKLGVLFLIVSIVLTVVFMGGKG